MKEKLIEKKYLVTFILITSLFALWGFANDITKTNNLVNILFFYVFKHAFKRLKISMNV